VTYSTTRNDRRLLRLAALAAEEAEALLALLPRVQDVQFDRSPAGMGERDETGRRASGGHSDPTADIATDPARLYLRTVLARSEPHLADAASRLRGVREGLARALTRWEGTEPDPDPSAQ
jgi:hypothetical protein